MAASQTRAKEIIKTPYELKLGDILESATVNNASPTHMAKAAKKSRGPTCFFWMTMLPINTGISLQHLKMTCVG